MKWFKLKMQTKKLTQMSLKYIFKEKNRLDIIIFFGKMKMVYGHINSQTNYQQEKIHLEMKISIPKWECKLNFTLPYYENNLNSTITLVKAMQEYGCSNMIFSSSATVYGVPESVPLVETMSTGPCTNPYGWTKLMNEQMLMDFATADKSLSVVLLRYFNPVGAHKSGLIGEDPAGIPNNLMPFVSLCA